MPTLLDSMLMDLRYAARALVKSRTFAIVAVLTLALGIGANTAIFSVVNGVLLNRLPFHDGNQLVVLFQESENFKNGSISYPNFVDWRRMNKSFVDMACYRGTGFNLSGVGDPERVQGEMISAGFFEILGVNPILGRTFHADEDRLGANRTVMISEGFWKRKMGSQPDVLGKVLTIDGVPRTVIGVVPGWFHLQLQNFGRGRNANEFYLPVGEFNEPQFYAARGNGWGLDGVARLKPGVTFEQAVQDMNRVSRDLAAAYPAVNANKKANLVPLKEELVGNIRPVLLVLLGAVFFVLLISCVNVANLLLARSTSRQREFAVRIALGAGQRRLIRQLLTESLLLGLIGGAWGLLLAKLGTEAVLANMPTSLPRAEEIALDSRVLLFTLVISMMAGMIFGLAPAWKTGQTNIAGALKESGRGVAAGGSRAQAAFVVCEIAMALVLLIGAGLMIRTLVRLWGLNPGFNPQNVMTFSISGPPSYKDETPDAIRAAYRQIRAKVAATPGVESASFNWGSHPMQGDEDDYFWFPNKPKPRTDGELAMALLYIAEPDYLHVMQLQLKQGRFFIPEDNEHAAPVAVIDDTLAEKYFAGQNPIGQYLDMDPDTNGADKQPARQIVGIVGHINQWGLDIDSKGLQAQIYLPFAQISDKELKRSGLGTELFIRTKPMGAPTFEVLRQRILEFNRSLVVSGVRDLQQTVANSVAGKRFAMILLALFAGLALLLASVGIYGVLSYMVGQRTQEIGVRMALGAQQKDVLRMVLMDGAQMTAAGIGLGIAAAFALTQLMSSMLFGVKPTDPVTFLSVTGLLTLIAFLACYIPARRATYVDPMVALRNE